MTQHDDNCDWHVDQYPWECTCGAIPRKAAMDKLIADDADLIDPVRDERQETIKLCLRNAIDWESVGNHKSAAFWRNVASEIQTVEALTAENEQLRGALEKMQRSRDRYREAWEAEKAHGTARVSAALAGSVEQ